MINFLRLVFLTYKSINKQPIAQGCGKDCMSTEHPYSKPQGIRTITSFILLVVAIVINPYFTPMR